ncbi:OmpH family outer membrane protein [Salinibacter ruber]|uniref:Outer membrane protein OmpH, putative n=3 Tax=Salinibacter ruber TaxID=146919 RepID=Q2S1H4_SALRD|nr:OmpH family outer membrane protein [Salinibacter ruber]ABC44454.1 outer membrane protein OmpH, putative [Salinibacter ruber DSM 13855]MCS3664028.1 outer membrane protein [Salinibacter ruber]MCS4056177.1 outer membrane protein [Salinibacter ruber]MCS4134966.1 outer membrane protein [Salinibacter ruber]MCS4161509.1 outer membrane protein [Salinibacter ruber]
MQDQRCGGGGTVRNALAPPTRHLARVVVMAAALCVLWGGEARAQQKIGYIDSQAILEKLPEYASVEQKLDQLEDEWRAEIEAQEEQVQALRDEYRAWELLYTDEERRQKQAAIQKAREKVDRLRQRYFGPDGRLYTRQQELMRPIQERILDATEEVATEEGYDYVFDKSEKVLFMYARQDHNLNRRVLRALGITPGQQTEGQ